MSGSPTYRRQRRAFRLHAGVFAGSVIVILAVNLALNLAAGIAGEWWAWWSALALLGWGLGVAIHGFAVRMSRFRTLAAVSEERQIDEILSSSSWVGAEPPR